MAYNDGTPVDQSGAPAWIAKAHPVNWVDWAGSEQLGVSPQAVFRGHPPAMSWWMKRLIPTVRPIPQPTPVYLHSRPYDRGAGAYAPKFGTLYSNPIGGGVPSAYKLPVIAGPGARFQAGAIWFDVQSVPTGMRFNGTVPIETIDALIAESSVGPSYLGS
jgi:hypothetical protein